MLDALRLSVGTLTIVPSGAIPEIDRRTAARAMIIAPLAVLPLASVSAVVGWIAHFAGLPPLAVGLLVVGCLALGSRALHLDGLADTVDGFGAGWTAERSLMVMRRGDVGPMGVVALIVVLGLQAVCIGELVHSVAGALLICVAVCCSRAALCLTCLRGVPAARNEGLGVAVADSVPRLAAAGCWVAVLVIMAGAAALIGHNPASGALAAAAAALAVGVSGLPLGTPAGWHHRRRHGCRDRDRVHGHDHRGDHMRSQSQGPSGNDHDHFVARRGHLLVGLSQQLGEHPARSVRRHQAPAHLVGHREREAATGLPRLHQVIQLILEIRMPVAQRLLPGAEPVDHGSEPSAEAVDQDRPRSMAQRRGNITGLDRAPVRRPPRSMIGDAFGPFCVGFGIGWRPNCDIGDLGALGEQRFGVTRLAGAYAAGDQNAPIRAGEVRINQRGHRR